MSARVTRKRSRPEDEDQELPPTKREPAQDTSSEDNNGGVAADGTGADRQPNHELAKERGGFWFEDGTVILVARNVEYRVYRGVLAELSSVFNSLFAKPRAFRNVPLDGVPTFPCPVVRVSDSPEDFQYLLRACFVHRMINLYEERNPSYYEISALIRLGDKYKITDLYSQSLNFLKHHFPSSFDSWVALPNFTPPGWDVSEAIGVVNLARMTGELSLLPPAFVTYICAKETAPGIVHGITREDGSQERLSPDDLIACFEGQAKLRTASVAAVLRTFNPTVSPECKTISACKKRLRDAFVGLEYSVDDLLNGNPFAKYDEFLLEDDLDACPSCTSTVSERSLKERKDVWDMLPELLGINVPGWNKDPPPPPA
ncbi:hypothetical protein GSI_12035 [Ganoderma sinense ZZ0214-1]|uniref:Uncharacterized protein n=1 Tax=Ganoderma sinense ZZ0214-1 TaxID=1077348 RepID=A0A2G8RXN1_9APHY|nr:hypothetical protein GSI_12035 [Ganoderma sinense ZZ0214-1]